MLKTIIPIILIFAMLTGFFFWSLATAHAAGSVVGGGICAVGFLLGFFGGSDTFYCIDNFVIRPLIRKIVNALENRLLNAMGDIINDTAGGGKDPHFITNWRNQILDSEARGNDVFRAVLADTALCPYFSDSLKQSFGAEQFAGLIDGSGNLTYAPGTDPFQVSAKCTFDYDIDAFAKDFNNGGWEAWNQLLEPQNNFFGAYSAALAERDRQVAIESQASRDERLANNGYLPSRLDDFLGGTHASGCAKKGVETRCTFLGKTVTPGAAFGQAVGILLSQKANGLNQARDMQDVLLAIADSIISKISGKLNNLLTSDRYEEREYQSHIDAARRSGGGGTAAQEQQRLACENTCQTQAYPQCSSATAAPFGYQNENLHCFTTLALCAATGSSSCGVCSTACTDGSTCSPLTSTPTDPAQQQCVNRAIASCILNCQ